MQAFYEPFYLLRVLALQVQRHVEVVVSFVIEALLFVNFPQQHWDGSLFWHHALKGFQLLDRLIESF